MQKPSRKNAHKERIFSIPQNKIDFGYQKEHQDSVPKGQRISSKKEVEVPNLLTANKARESLRGVDGWQLTDDHKRIYREFILHDFMAAVDMIAGIAVIAEEEKHHPDIHLTQYRNLRVGLTTHEVGGLSEKDFTVASKINGLPSMNKAVSLNQQLQDKNTPIQKPRYEQKELQLKKTKVVSPVLKKEKKSLSAAKRMKK